MTLRFCVSASSLLLALFSLITSVSTVVHADIVLAPVSISSSYTSASGSSLNDLINQNGLASNYTSGSTDFATYIASAPAHNDQVWLTTETRTGTFDFDFGAEVSLNGIALWNRGGGLGGNLGQFNLLADSDGDFS